MCMVLVFWTQRIDPEPQYSTANAAGTESSLRINKSKNTKCCIHSVCILKENTDGVQSPLLMCAVIVQQHKQAVIMSVAVSTRFVDVTAVESQAVSWADEWRKCVTRCTFLPQNKLSCCFMQTSSSSASSQTGWTPEKPRASAVTEHTLPYQSALHQLPQDRLAVCLSLLLQTRHMPVRTRRPGICRKTRWTCREFQVVPDNASGRWNRLIPAWGTCSSLLYIGCVVV